METTTLSEVTAAHPQVYAGPLLLHHTEAQRPLLQAAATGVHLQAALTEVLLQAVPIEVHHQAVTLQAHPEAAVASQVEVTPAEPADQHHQEAQEAVKYADAKQHPVIPETLKTFRHEKISNHNIVVCSSCRGSKRSDFS